MLTKVSVMLDKNIQYNLVITIVITKLHFTYYSVLSMSCKTRGKADDHRCGKINIHGFYSKIHFSYGDNNTFYTFATLRNQPKDVAQSEHILLTIPK